MITRRVIISIIMITTNEPTYDADDISIEYYDI